VSATDCPCSALPLLPCCPPACTDVINRQSTGTHPPHNPPATAGLLVVDYVDPWDGSHASEGLVVILIVVKHPVKPEYPKAWPALVHEFTEATRLEPGNVSFDWNRATDDPNVWLLVEAFQDQEAGKAHVQSTHFQSAIAKLPTWLTDVPEIIHVETPSDGWARMSEIQVQG
jgi:quinol monooxygenase YgiN